MGYRIESLREQLVVFENKSKEIVNICLQQKSNFLLGHYSSLYNNVQFEVNIYFSDDYKTWSISVDKMEYKGFMKAMEIPSIAIHDPQYLDEILSTMDKVIKKIECKPRKLKFKTDV